MKGSVKTQRLVVQGYIEGTINAERVEIKAAGHVSGEITSSELVIESKGVFEGNSIFTKSTKKAVQSQTDVSKS